MDGKNVVLQEDFAVFSVSNGYTTLFNILDNTTIVRQLSAVFVFCFVNEIFYKAILQLKFLKLVFSEIICI